MDVLYLGPGKGSRHVLRCNAIGFSKDLGDGTHDARALALLELEDLVFALFRKGDFTFESVVRDTTARELIALCDEELIQQMYSDDPFRKAITYHELAFREIMDEAIYRIGDFSNKNAKRQAIQLLKRRIEDGKQ